MTSRVCSWLTWLTPRPRTIYYVIFCATNIAAYGLWILMAYLTEVWEVKLTDAAAIVNVIDGLTAIMSVGIAFLTDAYFGGYSMALITAVAYSTGFGLLTMSSPPALSKVLGTCHEQKAACIGKLQYALFYVASLVIVIGRAGYLNSLPTFWNEQLHASINSDSEKAKQCTDIEWIYSSSWIIIIGTIIIASFEFWTVLYGALAVLMTIAALFFLCGIPSYIRVKPRGSPLTRVLRVFVAATLKMHVQCPSNISELHNPEGVELPFPCTNQLRFLEKASIITSQGLDTEQSHWKLCTVTEVEETKCLIGMSPMWITFLTCGAVLSVGNTYFLEQGNKMKTAQGKILSNSSEFNQGCTPKVRIGVGMIVSVLCCSVAALVETKRLKVIKDHGLLDDLEATAPMSIIWLMPQFLLLGAMDGLVTEGIRQFFHDNGPDSMKTYAEPFTKSVIGVGTILSVALVAISNKVSKIGKGNGWFADTLNRSHLDYFYWTLACLSFLNLSGYVFFLKGYTIKRGTEKQPSRSNTVFPVRPDNMVIRPFISNTTSPVQETVISTHSMVVPVRPDNMVIRPFISNTTSPVQETVISTHSMVVPVRPDNVVIKL